MFQEKKAEAEKAYTKYWKEIDQFDLACRSKARYHSLFTIICSRRELVRRDSELKFIVVCRSLPLLRRSLTI